MRHVKWKCKSIHIKPKCDIYPAGLLLVSWHWIYLFPHSSLESSCCYISLAVGYMCMSSNWSALRPKVIWGHPPWLLSKDRFQLHLSCYSYRGVVVWLLVWTELRFCVILCLNCCYNNKIPSSFKGIYAKILVDKSSDASKYLGACLQHFISIFSKGLSLWAAYHNCFLGLLDEVNTWDT